MKWKDEAPYVLCLTHDVDRVKKQWYHYCYYGLKHPVKQLKTLRQKLTKKDPYWNFEEIVELEGKYGVKSTFLFLNESHKELSANFLGRYKINDSYVSSMIIWLDQKGFDIGLHGSFFSYHNRTQLMDEKKQLETILGHPVVSTRQHHLNFDDQNTWRVQKEAGLRYDSTIGHASRISKEQPYRTKEGIIEIPLTLMDTMQLNEETFSECMTIAENHGVIMLNFHQCHFNRTEYPQNVKMYERLLSKAKADGAWISNMTELGDWLNERL